MKRVKHLSKGDEDRRRWNIIGVSSAKDPRYIPQLVARLKGDESYGNKRHMVRALGNIGDASVGEFLLSLLQSERGLIISEIAEALGKLKYYPSYEILKTLVDYPTPIVAAKARWAVKQIKDKK